MTFPQVFHPNLNLVQFLTIPKTIKKVGNLSLAVFYLVPFLNVNNKTKVNPCGFTFNWKTQARMTPGAKVDLTPENNLYLTPEEFGRRGQFYFGLSAFEGFEFTDAFAGERDTVCGVDDAVKDGIRHCGVADGVVPVQFGEL